MEFDFSSDKPKRGPPARFAMRQREASSSSKESKPSLVPTNEATPNTGRTRRVVAQPVTDLPIAFTKETSVDVILSSVPNGVKILETIDTSAKWQEKVEAFESITQFVKANASSISVNSEAFVVYAMSFANQMKASNINILKSAIECILTVSKSCDIGPRSCLLVIPAILPKIHDKKLGPIIFDLLSTMCEKIGPYPVIECVQNGMETSKIPMQQKAVLQWMETLVKDFGASSLDVKQILTYLQKPQAFQSSNPAVKSAATSLLLELYRQLGPVITSVLDQFDLSDLQKKGIRSVLESAQYEPPSTSQPSAPSSEAPGLAQSLLSLREPSDISSELTPLLRDLRTTGEKDSWKIRQEAVLQLTALLTKKQPITDSTSVSELVVALKDRLFETNLNLRTKVIQCVGCLASALGAAIQRYTLVLIPELMKLSGDSKASVVTALFETLTKWIVHDGSPQPLLLNSLLPHLALGCKSPKGRQYTLQWLRQYASLCDPHALEAVISEVLDGVLDKTKEARTAATDVLEVLLNQGRAEAVLQIVNKRSPTDASQLRSVIEAFTSTCTTPIVSSAAPAAVPAETEVASGRAALARRKNANVLVKPKLGANGKPLPKYNVKSSIPRPQPIQRASPVPAPATSSFVSPPVVSSSSPTGSSFTSSNATSFSPNGAPLSPNPTSFSPNGASFSPNPTSFSPSLAPTSTQVEPSSHSIDDSMTNDSHFLTEKAFNSSLSEEEPIGPLHHFHSSPRPTTSRISVGIPSCPSDLLLSKQESKLLPHPPLRLPSDVASSLFVTHLLDTLREAQDDLRFAARLSYSHLVSSLQELANVCDALTLLLLPKCGIPNTRMLSVSQSDLDSITNRIDLWLSKMTQIVNKLICSGRSNECSQEYQSVLNAIASVFSPESRAREMVMSLTADCVYCIMKMCFTILLYEGGIEEGCAQIHVSLAQGLLIRTAECCHPSSIILAVITAASHMNLKEGSPFLKALDGMLLRVKTRLNHSVQDICILPMDTEKIQLRLQRRIPKLIEMDVKLCLYVMQRQIEGNHEVPIMDSLYSMESLRSNEKMADFFRWRESHSTTMPTDSTDPVERWKQLHIKLRQYIVCLQFHSLHSH